MKPEELAEIEARLNHGGDDWTPREIEMKGDIARLLAEVRRFTPAPKVAKWEAGVDDYEGCTVLRDPASGAVLGWYVEGGVGGCVWLSPVVAHPRQRITTYATKNGWEVRDGE